MAELGIITMLANTPKKAGFTLEQMIDIYEASGRERSVEVKDRRLTRCDRFCGGVEAHLCHSILVKSDRRGCALRLISMLHTEAIFGRKRGRLNARKYHVSNRERTTLPHLR